MILTEKNQLKFNTRLIVQKGTDYIPLKLSDVALIQLSNNIVYIIDKEGRKFIKGNNLNHIYSLLDRDMFFRANRQFIINVNFISSFKPYERVKISVELSLKHFTMPIIISQDNAAQFRKWIHGR